MNKRHVGLSTQLFIAVFLSLLLAAASFVPCYFLGEKLLDKTVYGKSFLNKMADLQFADLQNYVYNEHITQSDLKFVDVWCMRGERLRLAIYQANRIIYESNVTSEGDLDPEEFDISQENPSRAYELSFSNGSKAKAFLYYYAGGMPYRGVIFLSSIVALSVFFVTFTTFIHRKIKYIKHLKSELDILSGGDLGYQVLIKGNDEISELAMGIDEMRKSIVAHQASEDSMRMANSQLVTAMSHDLRTPLTSLLGYLELMERGKYQDEAQLKHFIDTSLAKTLRIKDMADKLFEYFLAYSSEWDQPVMERADADNLFEQFLLEFSFALENKGFTVTTEISELSGSINVDTDLMRRAFDNMYSNILKYGDPTEPVLLLCKREGATVRLVVDNAVSSSFDKNAGTNIGLGICARIMEYHNGSFKANEEGGRFLTTIGLPLGSSVSSNLTK